MTATNVMICGVGGQGAVLASELLALAALHAGYDVKQGEFHGVAQRGGAVFSHVRFGTRVHSPVTPRGEVDVLLALEKLEALRHAHLVKPGGTIVLNDHVIEPIRTTDDRPYPHRAIAFLAEKGFEVVSIAATERARELGNHRAANTVLLGALAALLDIPADVWDRTLVERIPEHLLAVNQRAFAAGREVVAAPA